MRIDVQELAPCKRSLRVEAPREEVQTAWAEAYDRVAKMARIPGFRRGKVPRQLVKLHFANEIRQEVVQKVIPELYRQALAEARLDPVDEPEVQDLEVAEDQPVRFRAVVEVKPAIALEGYQGVRVRHTPHPVTPEEVQSALEALRERQAEFRAVSRPAQRGDLAIIDYEVSVGGKPLPDGKQEGLAVIIGSSQLLPEIEAACVGLGAGEERVLDVRLPDTYERLELRGKEARFRVRVVEVKEKILPELSDEFARLIGEFQTLDALREAISEDLAARRELEERQALGEKVLDAVLGRHPFEVPESLVLRQVAQTIGHAQDRMRQQGLDPGRMRLDYDKLLGEFRPWAVRAVQRRLLLEAVADAEKIRVAEEELEAEVAKIAEGSGRSPQAIRAMLSKSGELEGLRRSLRESKTLDLLIATAKIEPEP